MSQRRLIVSLALISSCLALVIALAAWTFPLKAQGVAGGVAGGVTGGIAQGVAQDISGGVAQGIANGVAGGVSGGVAGGVSGGVSGGISTRASAEEPSVDYSTVWLDTVKRGAMPLQVRGAGTIVHGDTNTREPITSPRLGSADLVARVTVPASMSADVKPGQSAAVASKNGTVGKGRVRSVGLVSNDTRTVDIVLDAVPQGTAPGLEVMANIEIGKLDNVLFVGRPVNTTANGETRLFKILNNGAQAVRTPVKLGRASANTIEILDGLQEGDKVILSDMSSVANAERIRLTDDNHVLKH